MGEPERERWLEDELIGRSADVGEHRVVVSGLSPERIEEEREKIRRAVEDGERLYRKGMHDPDGLSAKDDFRLSGILSLDLPDALGAFDRLAAALREAREALKQIAETARWYADNGQRLAHEVDHALCVEILSIAENAVLPPVDEAKP